MTDQERNLLQILDGTPHAHLFRRFHGGRFAMSTDLRPVDSEMCESLLDRGLLRWNGHGYYITQSGADAIREKIEESHR